MKHILALSILALSLLSGLYAQKPEPIYSFARVYKSIPYYKEQAALWKKEVDKNPKNSFAWYNYYRVNRNLSRVDSNDKRSFPEKEEALKKLVDEMGKAVPDSYDYNLCKWMSEGNNYDFVSYLKKASELAGDRTEIYSEMINWGEIERNIKRRDEFADKWYKSDNSSPGLLYYNYNVMKGIKPNAVLITAGDNDTYFPWILQSQGIRRDITIVNLGLAGMDSYREKIFKELKIPQWDTTQHRPTKENCDPYSSDIIRHIAENTKDRPVYVALTVGPDYISAVEDKLYLTGLAYEYSKESIDNMAVMKRNFEQYYALDYLDKPFYSDPYESIVKNINGNYLVPMLKLYDHYKASGDTQKQEWIKQKMLTVSAGTEEEQEIKKRLQEN